MAPNSTLTAQKTADRINTAGMDASANLTKKTTKSTKGISNPLMIISLSSILFTFYLKHHNYSIIILQ